MIDAYKNLSSTYYDLIKPQPSDEEYNFYKNYLKKSNRALEPMCGSGRFLIPYSEEGFDIDGFDSSPYMISILKSRLKSKFHHSNIWEDDIEIFKAPINYDYIFIPSGSFGHLIEIDAIQQSLSRLEKALSPLGIIVFEVETRSCLPKDIDGSQFNSVQCSDNKIIKLERCMTVNDQVCKSQDTYKLVENNQVILEESEIFQIRLHDNLDLILHGLKRSGLMIKEIINGPPGSDTERPAFYRLVCKKLHNDL